MNDIEKKSRGHQAEALLKDELLQEAIRQVRYAAHRAFERAKGDEDALRRAAYLLDAANDFQRFLTLAVSQGDAAAKKIDAEMSEGKIIRGIGRLVRNRAAEGMPWSATR